VSRCLASLRASHVSRTGKVRGKLDGVSAHRDSWGSGPSCANPRVGCQGSHEDSHVDALVHFSRTGDASGTGDGVKIHKQTWDSILRPGWRAVRCLGDRFGISARRGTSDGLYSRSKVGAVRLGILRHSLDWKHTAGCH
jgi:hypothetical protein